MQITKFTYRGREADIDIGFTEGGAFLRFASDETPKPGFRDAYKDLCQAAGEVAGFALEIRRIKWKREDVKETTVVIEGVAPSKTGEDMRVRLPEIGWRKVLVEKVPGELQEEIRPIGTDELGISAIMVFEDACSDYVRSGSGQLDLFQPQQPPGVLRKVADHVYSFKA